VEPEELVKALLTWRSVQTAYFDPPGSDPLVNAADDPRAANQGYLDPAPDGIDAEFAWGFAGGDGAGQHLIDLERGWTLNHEDLVAHGAALLHGTILDTSRPHGTSVLGEVCASDNTRGCVGIVRSHTLTPPLNHALTSLRDNGAKLSWCDVHHSDTPSRGVTDFTLPRGGTIRPRNDGRVGSAMS
jgi:hypothetical protein